MELRNKREIEGGRNERATTKLTCRRDVEAIQVLNKTTHGNSNNSKMRGTERNADYRSPKQINQRQTAWWSFASMVRRAETFFKVQSWNSFLCHRTTSGNNLVWDTCKGKPFHQKKKTTTLKPKSKAHFSIPFGLKLFRSSVSGNIPWMGRYSITEHYACT